MATRTDHRPAPLVAALLVTALAGGLAGCRDHEHAAEVEPESWSVTAWGERYEVFPEVDPLVAGTASPAHTHVTVLGGFQPLTEGHVEIVLRSAGGEQVFAADTAVRPGIFNIDVAPTSAGEYELLFRIRSAAGPEEIRGGTVRVGDAASPGGVVRAPAPRGATDAGEPVPFLKEQQWRTAFATEWVRTGKLAEGARGLARVRPPAGGDATLTASVDGVVQPSPWPYPGQSVGAGEVLFRVVPRVATESSLGTLRADVTTLQSELASAQTRLARLEELLAAEATSRREVEEARTRVATLSARLAAARGDLGSASAAREGRGGAEAHAVRAPFAGAVAAVAASPGASVAAGDVLGRVVRSGAVWLEIDLPPVAARRLAAEGATGLVVESETSAPLRFTGDQVRLVSLAPEVDASRGTVTALVEVTSPTLILGTTVEAQVLLGGEREGIVVPATAIVDDGGVFVVYLQLSGERFARQQVEVLSRQGDRVLVGGLAPGQRLVTQGGDAIRRAGLMSNSAAEGHVH
jgi:cobalt-zinc-cadmium efflux system membrane fusion protein